ALNRLIARGYPNTLCIFYGSIMGVQSPSTVTTLGIDAQAITARYSQCLRGKNEPKGLLGLPYGAN
ncbi:MAG: hypothetical protein QF566_06100, partial [Candidatus Thalassarchaeaceae archaeon]|nr:hypothetical protein [Candidatus Thalassarchaeaceae archaeon]